MKKRADEYRLQAEQLDREVKQNKKELYESQKKAIQANMEIDRWKEKNQDLLVSVEIVKRDPKMLQEINQCRPVKRDAKQIYKQNLKEDRDR